MLWAHALLWIKPMVVAIGHAFGIQHPRGPAHSRHTSARSAGRFFYLITLCLLLGQGWAVSSPLIVTSSNPDLLPEDSIVVDCVSNDCTLTLRPVPDQGGVAVVRFFADTPSGRVPLVPTWETPATNVAPPALTVPAEVTLMGRQPVPITGISLLADGEDVLSMWLGVEFGRLRLRLDVPGGVTATQVSGDNSGQLDVQATAAELKTTLAASEGLVYEPPATPPAVGGDVLTIEVRRTGGSGLIPKNAASAQVVLQFPPDPLAAWRGRFFDPSDLADPAKENTVWGDRADPDRDGRDNLMEFALGLQPTVPDRAADPIRASLIEQGGKKFPCMVFVRRKNEPDLIYLPEVSADGQTWHSAPDQVQVVQVEDLGNGFERVTYQDRTEVTPGRPRYFRLRVVKTEP